MFKQVCKNLRTLLIRSTFFLLRVASGWGSLGDPAETAGAAPVSNIPDRSPAPNVTPRSLHLTADLFFGFGPAFSAFAASARTRAHLFLVAATIAARAALLSFRLAFASAGVGVGTCAAGDSTGSAGVFAAAHISCAALSRFGRGRRY